MDDDVLTEPQRARGLTRRIGGGQAVGRVEQSDAQIGATREVWVDLGDIGLLSARMTSRRRSPRDQHRPKYPINHVFRRNGLNSWCSVGEGPIPLTCPHAAGVRDEVRSLGFVLRPRSFDEKSACLVCGRWSVRWDSYAGRVCSTGRP